MKKKCCLITCIILSLLLANGCLDKKDKLYVADVSVGLLSGNINEYNLSDKYETANKKMKDGEVCINGKNYKSPYKESISSAFNNSDAVSYAGFNGDDEVFFRLNANDGSLVNFWINDNSAEDDEYGEKSYDECYQIALEYLEEFDQTDGRYELENPESSKKLIDTHRGSYNFVFIKKAGENKTNIVASIYVNTCGDIWAFSVPYIKSMDNEMLKKVETLTFDENLYDERIEARLDELIPEESKKDIISWNIADVYYSCLEGQKLCLNIEVDIEKKFMEDEDGPINGTYQIHFISFV